MNKLLIIIISLLSFNSYAISSKEVKAWIFPYMKKVIGEKRASELLNINAYDDLVIPNIPELKNINFKSPKRTSKLRLNLSKEKQNKYDEYYIKELFLVTRQLKYNVNDLSRWLNVLSQGGTREGIYRALVLDSTYRGLESYDKPVNKDILEFIKYFYKKFFQKDVSDKKFRGVNFYYLKRVFVEEVLVTIDILNTLEGDQIFNWYSAISADISRRYSEIWINKFRKSTDQKMHNKWAMSANEQYIKSELIIKLHKTFNYLILK